MTAQQTTSTTTEYRIHPETHVGHVHLRIANLERAIAFYRDLLGFTITLDMRTEPKPRQLAFLSASHAAGHYHHHVALAEFPGVTPPTTQQAGLFHIAFLYPSRLELAQALRRILDHGYPIDSCHDYGVGEAVNLRDPDGIPLELYYDRGDDQLRMFNQRIDAATILAELENKPATDN